LTHINNFAVEQGNAEKGIEWMNSFAKRNHIDFQVKSEGYSLSTINFGNFEVVSWNGEWRHARNIILKVSSKLNMKVIEAGYHQKNNLISSLFGVSREYAKVYNRGNLVGNLELGSKTGKWIVKGEKLG
jgi:hypothetical protein